MSRLHSSRYQNTERIRKVRHPPGLGTTRGISSEYDTQPDRVAGPRHLRSSIATLWLACHGSIKIAEELGVVFAEGVKNRSRYFPLADDRILQQSELRESDRAV
jgi:hypothetical protein